MVLPTDTGISRRSHSFLSIRPVVLSVAGSALITLVVTRVSSFEIDTGAIFSGVFDLTTIFAGFLATFYVFVVARQNRFLQAIQHTQSFRDAVGLLRFNLYWTANVICLSWLCMILKFEVVEPWSWRQYVILFWSFNVVLLLVNFLRSVAHFNTIISAREIGH